MTDGIIIVGGGGHAKVVAEALRAAGERVLGFTDPRADAPNLLPGVANPPRRLGDDAFLAAQNTASTRLALGIGSVRPGAARADLFARLKDMGFRFATVVHPSAVVAADAILGEGCQIMAGAVIQPGCRIGDGAIVNTRASVDHDGTVGRFVHVAPGATLSGGVTLGDGCHVGTGAVVVQNVAIGANAFVTAGAVVTADVAADAKTGRDGR